MIKRNPQDKTEIPDKFIREHKMVIDGFEIVKGDIIKIAGQRGLKFKFDSIVTNPENSSIWVDCFEMFRATASQYRSFRVEDVKRIPQRGKRAKRVI